MLENTEGAIKMDNPEKLATWGTQNVEKQDKNTAQCVGHHYAQANTNNVNKTWALLQTTGGKDKPNIFFMWKSLRTSQHGTRNIKTHNRTTQKTKKMSNMDPTFVMYDISLS